MKARLAIIAVASACLLAAIPAHAQNTIQQSGPPPQNEVVGPPQLSNFSLNGTVTREATTPAPAPARQQPPSQTAVTPQPSSTTNRQNAPAQPSSQPPATNRGVVSEASAPPAPAPQQTQSPAVMSSPDLTAEQLTDTSAEPQLSFPPPAQGDSGAGAASGGVPFLPWIIAALVAAIAAGWFLYLRLRPRESFAGVSDFGIVDAPAADGYEPAVRDPEPDEPIALPPLPPAPAPTPPTGVVSTRLRPWLEIEFKPDRAIVDDDRAAVAFEVSVLNSGSVPARDILLEASLFNAGAMQDQQIKLFFDNPVARGDRIPVIPPMQRVTVNTAVFLARDQVRPIEIEGRSLFVPMVAFNALYRWGGGEGQTSASYLVGKETKGDKLAPFRLDLAPRIFRGLAGREHELKVRK
jgi:hypothetical protein